MSQNELIAETIQKDKYLQPGETWGELAARIAGATATNDEHFRYIKQMLEDKRYLPAGRIMSSVGSARITTPFNCFVSPKIPDSLEGISSVLTYALQTLRLGGGIGYDFSTLRPSGARITSLDSSSSGPVGNSQPESKGFMDLFDSGCATIRSAGHRRGAQMGVLRVDHPDIQHFVKAKHTAGRLTNFNVSVGITDKFMECVETGEPFPLVFEGKEYDRINAKNLWDEIMRSTWEYAEPGVLFLDTINRKNNLWYCETITATNPCLHPDSMIETVHGRVRIADIKEPTMVYTMKEDGSLGIEKCSASWITQRNTKVIKIKTRNGKEIKVTPCHKILVHLSDGKIKWVEASKLELGSRLVQLCRARRGVGYSGVKLTTEDNRAYRMEHRLIADSVYGIEKYHDVHHIDGDTYNNSIDNLQVLSHFEHSRYTALFDNPQSHQTHGEDGKFVSTGITPKTIIPMPEELRSNMKNDYSSCVESIEECEELTDVYDLTVDNTHNFIADFTVVHNCGEQPLPPHGACLLGSLNLTRYIKDDGNFDYETFKLDILAIVPMMDRIIDIAIYPHPEQEDEAKSKRRMGLGITGLAHTAEVMGFPYGSVEMKLFTQAVLTCLRNTAYQASIDLAKKLGSFPLFDKERFVQSGFCKSLPDSIVEDIRTYGIRNSHLLSIAPTGTISLAAGNVSSSIEPPYITGEYERKVFRPDGSIQSFDLTDWALDNYGVECVDSQHCSADDHLSILNIASHFVDSSVSKTINVGPEVTFDEFKEVYKRAYVGGSSGCTTFRPQGSREGIFSSKEEKGRDVAGVSQDTGENTGAACYIDPETGMRTCE